MQFLYTSDQGIFAQNCWSKINFLYTSDHNCSDFLVRNAVVKNVVVRKVGNPSITVYIYAFLSHDSNRVREIKYWKFESNMDVHFCLTPLPPCPHVSASAWPPAPPAIVADVFYGWPLKSYLLWRLMFSNMCSRIKARQRSLARWIRSTAANSTLTNWP